MTLNDALGYHFVWLCNVSITKVMLSEESQMFQILVKAVIMQTTFSSANVINGSNLSGAELLEVGSKD